MDPHQPMSDSAVCRAWGPRLTHTNGRLPTGQSVRNPRPTPLYALSGVLAPIRMLNRAGSPERGSKFTASAWGGKIDSPQAAQYILHARTGMGHRTDKVFWRPFYSSTVNRDHPSRT